MRAPGPRAPATPLGRRALVLGGLTACGGARIAGAPRASAGLPKPVAWLQASLRYVRPGRALVALPSRPSTSSLYDVALVALVLMRFGHREAAGHLLGGVAEAQDEGGAIPFVLPIRGDVGAPYVRSGALAWIGYAAVDYLDGERGGPHRDEIARMAHRLADALARRTVRVEGDPRDGLVTGGRGVYRYEVVGGAPREIFEDGERDWASTEHAVDAYFFLRRLAELTGDAKAASAATRVAEAITTRAWDEDQGQLVRGVGHDGPDVRAALDCASWGGLLLASLGERERASRSLATAEARYTSTSPRVVGARGHKPYADGPVVESWALRRFATDAAAGDWSTFSTIWPEGTAGVALLALRLGDRARAARLLGGLEPLRDGDGALPTATDAVPYELDTAPSLAGTAWVELVRHELDGGAAIWRG